MTPEFKAKWIEALRSGKYQQTCDVLKDTNGGMCCLGVAADLIDPSKWAPEAVATHSDEKAGFGWGGDGPSLCKAVAKAIGIETLDARDLAERNDGNNHPKHSFAEIANVIEERL